MSVQHEVASLGELLEGDDSDEVHLACACMAELTHCGIYNPNMGGVEIVRSHEKICRGCLSVWEARGCGRCSCNPAQICEACILSAAK
jgi:hypothetical protein